MSVIVKVKCTTCHYEWEEDLTKHQAEHTIFKGDKKTKTEEYRFKCPRDGTYIVVPITTEE